MFPPPPNLSADDRAMLAGERGAAAKLAMRLLLNAARISGAPNLVDISSAHVDGCLYNGEVSLDFVKRLIAGGGKVAVPTTLNVGSVDLIHPELFRGSAELALAGRELMQAHLKLGCQPSFSCAPYQLPGQARPKQGEHIAWAESNAIVFANSVLGARTNRYGDFIDLAAAIAGRVPYQGLHTDAGRRGEIVFTLRGLSERLLHSDLLYTTLGLLIGKHSGNQVPVIQGLPASASEDQLKALGAAAASSGAVALFHAVGITPEAPTLSVALQQRPALQTINVTAAALKTVLDKLNAGAPERLSAVCLGTPHFSLSEFERLNTLLTRYGDKAKVPIFIHTARATVAELDRRGWRTCLDTAGITLVTDTCTYVTPILQRFDGAVMTNSGKWAYYAPGNIGVRPVLGELDDCLASAFDGRIYRNERRWH